MLTVLVETWDCRMKTLSFLISNLIKLAVAISFFSSVVLGWVVWFFVLFFLKVVTFIL